MNCKGCAYAMTGKCEAFTEKPMNWKKKTECWNYTAEAKEREHLIKEYNQSKTREFGVIA